MGTKIGKGLSAELEIDAKRVFQHSDSLLIMFWLKKHQDNLTLMYQIESKRHKMEVLRYMIQAQIRIQLIS